MGLAAAHEDNDETDKEDDDEKPVSPVVDGPKEPAINKGVGGSG